MSWNDEQAESAPWQDGAKQFGERAHCVWPWRDWVSLCRWLLAAQVLSLPNLRLGAMLRDLR